MFGKFKSHPFGYHSAINYFCQSQPLFLLYDTVHILKNIRNNWINPKNVTFHFPDFENPEIMKSADFSHIRELYHKEKN